MSERDEADVPLQEVFKAKFGSSVNTAERLKAERRAGRTPKERHVHEFAKSSDERLVTEAARLIGGDFAAALGEALGVGTEETDDP